MQWVKSPGAIFAICLLALLTGCAATVTTTTVMAPRPQEAPAPRAVEPVDLKIDQHALVRGAIPFVGRDELVVPAKLAGGAFRSIRF